MPPHPGFFLQVFERPPDLLHGRHRPLILHAHRSHRRNVGAPSCAASGSVPAAQCGRGGRKADRPSPPPVPAPSSQVAWRPVAGGFLPPAVKAPRARVRLTGPAAAARVSPLPPLGPSPAGGL